MARFAMHLIIYGVLCTNDVAVQYLAWVCIFHTTLKHYIWPRPFFHLYLSTQQWCHYDELLLPSFFLLVPLDVDTTHNPQSCWCHCTTPSTTTIASKNASEPHQVKKSFPFFILALFQMFFFGKCNIQNMHKWDDLKYAYEAGLDFHYQGASRKDGIKQWQRWGRERKSCW